MSRGGRWKADNGTTEKWSGLQDVRRRGGRDAVRRDASIRSVTAQTAPRAIHPPWLPRVYTGSRASVTLVFQSYRPVSPRSDARCPDKLCRWRLRAYTCTRIFPPLPPFSFIKKDWISRYRVDPDLVACSDLGRDSDIDHVNCGVVVSWWRGGVGRDRTSCGKRFPLEAVRRQSRFIAARKCEKVKVVLFTPLRTADPSSTAGFAPAKRKSRESVFILDRRRVLCAVIFLLVYAPFRRPLLFAKGDNKFFFSLFFFFFFSKKLSRFRRRTRRRKKLNGNKIESIDIGGREFESNYNLTR